MNDKYHEMGPILASRELSRDCGDGVSEFAYVEIGMPTERHEGGWGCRVRTRGLGDDTVRTIYGEDSVQAIYLALAFAGVMVRTSKVAASLDWSQVPNFGFPEMPAIPGDDDDS